jgi:ATP-dependent DNA helicase RecG
LKVKGTALGSGADYNVASDNTVKYNVLSLVDKAWEELRTHLVETRFQDDARFRTTLIYPEVACREALVNAIAHRDYSEEGRGIEVYIYDDRIEVINPGSLLSSISLTDIKSLKGAHQSRNSFIARALREVGIMRELGEGMRRIHELMLSNELSPPEICSDDSTFRLSLHHRPMYSKDEVLWLSQYEDVFLSVEEKAIVLIGRRGDLIAPNDVIRRLGIVNIEHYRQLIESLQKKGLLVTTKTKSQVKAAQKREGVAARDVRRFKINSAKDIIEGKRGQHHSAEKTKPGALNETSKEIDRRKEKMAASFDDAAIYVANIPPNTTERDLIFTFREIGTLSSVRIPQSNGLSRGYAFVEFEDSAAARKALEARHSIGGRTLTLRWAVPMIRRKS